MSRQVAIGVGCRKGCSADAIEDVVRRAMAKVENAQPLGLFTLVDKNGEAGLSEAATRLGLGLTVFSREALRDQASRTQTSAPHAKAAFDVPSVAEAAALAGAGPDAVLLVPRIADGGVTCAIAGNAS